MNSMLPEMFLAFGTNLLDHYNQAVTRMEGVL